MRREREREDGEDEDVDRKGEEREGGPGGVKGGGRRRDNAFDSSLKRLVTMLAVNCIFLTVCL